MPDSALIPSHVRWAGIFLIAGFFIFFVAAFSSGPIHWRLGAVEYLESVDSHRTVWYWVNGCFLVSVMLTVVGFAAFTSVLRDAGDRLLSELGMVAYLFGAVFWIISLVFRVTLEVWAAREMAQSGVLPIGFEAWQQWAAMLFAIYMVIGYLSVAAYGGALLGTGLLARWLGWTAVIFGLAGALARLHAGLRRPIPVVPPAVEYSSRSRADRNLSPAASSRSVTAPASLGRVQTSVKGRFFCPGFPRWILLFR